MEVSGKDNGGAVMRWTGPGSPQPRGPRTLALPAAPATAAAAAASVILGPDILPVILKHSVTPFSLPLRIMTSTDLICDLRSFYSLYVNNNHNHTK